MLYDKSIRWEFDKSFFEKLRIKHYCKLMKNGKNYVSYKARHNTYFCRECRAQVPENIITQAKLLGNVYVWSNNQYSCIK